MPGGSKVVKGVLDLLKDQYGGKMKPMPAPTLDETIETIGGEITGGRRFSEMEDVTPAVFDPMSSASDAISKDPTDDDVVKMIIADLKGNGLISEGASADEIFEYAESIASSKNESMSKVGNILMSPKAQMVYMDDDF
jgi:hypothetical protein